LAASAFGASDGGDAVSLFDAKLTPEQKIEQAVSRLTFGARPADLEEARERGVEKWIELQLHPERIAENPALELKLKPLETIRMESADVLHLYFAPVRMAAMMLPLRINDLLAGDVFRKVYNGTAEERREAINALDPEKRMKVLPLLPDNVVSGLPDIRAERDEAQAQQQKERQAEQRRLRPPLIDLLDPQQREIALNGPSEKRSVFFASLDPEKLRKVAAALPPNDLNGAPELRRMGMMSRQPQQVALADLREAKVYRKRMTNPG
jgi:hypothetical protein